MEGLFNLIFGPFILFGILIVGFTVMSGGKADRAIGGYVRLCAQLFTSVLMPVLKRLPFLVTWLGQHIEYLFDAQVKAHRENTTFGSARSGTNSHSQQDAFACGNGRNAVIKVEVKDITEERRQSVGEPKTPNPYDDSPTIEAVES